jgi:hypothetical protein
MVVDAVLERDSGRSNVNKSAEMPVAKIMADRAKRGLVMVWLVISGFEITRNAIPDSRERAGVLGDCGVN